MTSSVTVMRAMRGFALTAVLMPGLQYLVPVVLRHVAGSRSIPSVGSHSYSQG
jgi:hypothetical protein